MKKLFPAAAAIFLISTSLFALEVNEPELRSTGGADVIQFQNYTGPHKVIETVAAINSIGTGLGNSVASDVNRAGTINPGAKYSVIHAIDPSESGKLDADIILINASATVDHIKNLRRIIASYLTAAYGYSAQDASTVATFVTVYNAVYRGKLDVFQSKYKNVVTKNLTAEKCGLSTKWSDWPGASQIVIPLNDLSGGLSTVDTSVISDSTVVQSMQEEDDKGVDSRKEMVDIKEREAENAAEKAVEAQKKADAEKENLKEQQQTQKEAEKKAEEKKQEAQEARKEADANPDDKEKQQVAEKKEEEAKEAEEKAEEEKQKTEEQEEVVQNAQEEADKQQAIADQKQEEAQQERLEIAKDQQKLVDDQLSEANANAVIGLTITDAAEKLSGMVKVNGATGEQMRTSPVTVIRARTILPVSNPDLSGADVDTEKVDASEMYLAICGENKNNGAVKLCLLDTNKMEIQKESAESLSEDSVLVNDGADYYVVIVDGINSVVAKYDKSLNLQLKSSENVMSSTPITVTEKGLVVTDANGIPALLNKADLSRITK